MPESPTIIRLDPSHSRAYSWLEWCELAEATDHHPVCSTLTVRYRTTGDEQTFWPVSREEAQKIFNPGAAFGYSIGSAVDQVIKKAGKSSRMVKSGDRQATKAQREEIEKREGRRWLA